MMVQGESGRAGFSLARRGWATFLRVGVDGAVDFLVALSGVRGPRRWYDRGNCHTLATECER